MTVKESRISPIDYKREYFELHFYRNLLRDAWSLQRILEIFSNINIKPKEYVLDVGCGIGIMAMEAYKRGARVIALDYNEESLKLAQEISRTFLGDFWQKGAINFIRASATDIPLLSNKLHTILAVDFVEHLTKREFGQFVVEAKRILKSNGELIIYTDNPVNYLKKGPVSQLLKIAFRLLRKGSYKILEGIPYNYPIMSVEDIKEHDQRWNFTHIDFKTPRYLKKLCEQHGFLIKNLKCVRTGYLMEKLPYPLGILWGGMTLLLCQKN